MMRRRKVAGSIPRAPTPISRQQLPQEKPMSLIEQRQRRILTTHVGSLPRPHSLSAKLFARTTGEEADPKALADELDRAVGDIVKTAGRAWHRRRQRRRTVEDQLSVLRHRPASGIEPITPKPGVRATRENRAFPTFYKDGSHSGTQRPAMPAPGRSSMSDTSSSRPTSPISRPHCWARPRSTRSCPRCRHRAASG